MNLSKRTVSRGLHTCILASIVLATPIHLIHAMPRGGQPQSSQSVDNEGQLDSKRMDFKTDKVALAIMNEYQLLMGDGVNVQVLPLPDNQYAIVLTGTVDESKIADLKQKAQVNRPTKYVPEQFLMFKVMSSVPTDKTIKDIGDLLTTLLSSYTSGPIAVKVLPKAPEPSEPDKRAADIKKWYDLLFIGDGVNVQVIALPRQDGIYKGKYAVILTGMVDKAKIGNLTNLAKSKLPDDVPADFLKLNLTEKKGNSTPPRPNEIMSKTTEAVSQKSGAGTTEKKTETLMKITVPPADLPETTKPTDKHYTVFLTGTINKDEANAIRDKTEYWKEQIKKQFKVTVDSIDTLQFTTLTQTVWPLTFMRGDAPQPSPSGLDAGVAAATAGSAQTTPDLIAAALTGIFGKDVTVSPYRHDLLLKGETNKVRQVRTLLAQWIDIPYSQVRLDVWTIQVNTSSTHGSRKEPAQQRMVTIREGIQLMRDLKTTLLAAMMDFVQQETPRTDIKMRIDTPFDPQVLRQDPQRGGKVGMRDLLKQAGFDPDPMHPLSLSDLFVYLAFCSQTSLSSAASGNVSNTLSDKLKVTLDNFCRQKCGELKDGSTDTNVQKTRKLYLRDLIARIRTIADVKQQNETRRDNNQVITDNYGILPRFIQTFAASRQPSLWKGIYDFFYYWDYVNSPSLPDDGPEKLTYTSAGADGLLKSAATRLNTDIEELCIHPLLAWIRDTVQRDNAGSSGIDMVGNSSIVVTSRLPAQTVASAESYFPFTPRARLSLDDLKSAQTLAQGSPSGGTKIGSQTTTTDAKTSTPATQSGTQSSTDLGTTTTQDVLSTISKTALTALGTITPLQGLALQAIFSSEPDTVYNKVGPGISLGVLPTVLRDGNSARLRINLITNTTADQPTNPRTSGAPVDLIRGHSLQTDVAVQALDLFELSTFATDTTRPGGPQWRIPILEMLPLIGRYFDGPASHETKHQESLVIVNVTILPRALDLAGGYLGGNPSH